MQIQTKKNGVWNMNFFSTLWEVKLEEPCQESGTTSHLLKLPFYATEKTVKKTLMNMKLRDGRPRYYEQDVNPPYLHYIKKVKGNEV